MHGRQSEDALTEAALAREIERALAVDPSPEFLARARARVAREPSPSPQPWRFWWALTPAALAIAAGVVAWLVVFAPNRGSAPAPVFSGPVTTAPGGDVAREAPSVVAIQRDGPLPQGMPGASKNQVRAVKSGARAFTDVRRDVRSFPEVIVSASEAEALRALVADAHSGRFTLALSVDAVRTGPSSEAADVEPEPTQIVIAPLAIQPLVELSPEELAGEVE